MTNSHETATEQSTGEVVDDADGMLAYNRFVRPALEEALNQVEGRLTTDGPPRILDAGCGPGGVFPLFTDVFGKSATAVAVDNSESHLEVAREQSQSSDLGDTISFERHDLTAEFSSEWGSFDVLWFSNVLFFFEDPVAKLDRFRKLLRPGGVVAAFYGGWDRATFLSGHQHLEALIYQSRMADLDRCPTDWRDRKGADHPECMPAWLTAAGSKAVRHDVLPVTYRRDSRGGLEEDVRRYLDQRLSEGSCEAVYEHRRDAGLSKSDCEQASRLVNPESDVYVLDQPGYYCHMPTLLTTATQHTGD